ncbi:hypothetical protein SCHPADRAFT_310032 [Schizopora paradoxa]|uniref:Hydrophobin n=1 Tax=Schizopora paradoxa TaxID=27342 RepID=A0A0H2SC99_9AGAM|nr:hypothetical protein SCHPADRAFT_310032 [Schizopora paradoxa]
MFKFKYTAALVLTTIHYFSIASPSPQTNSNAQCLFDEIMCCNQIQPVNSIQVQMLAGLLGINLSGVTGQVGLICTPLDILGGSTICSTVENVTLCCTGKSFAMGIIVTDCTLISSNSS